MLFSKRQKEIIDYLSNNHSWVTGKNLGEIFNVSSRTIRNDILSIKKYTNDDIILSSKSNGYRFNNDYNNLSNIEELFIMNSSDRLIYILSQLILNDNSINMYTLCEKLFISESTLLGDISTLKNLINTLNFKNVTLFKDVNTIILKCETNSYDKLITSIIKLINTDPSNSILTKIFTTFDVKKLSSTISKYLISIDFTSKYLTLTDIIAYTGLILERTYLDKKPPIIKNFTVNTHSYEFLLSKSIIELLEKEFFIDINNCELTYFTYNISSLINFENKERALRLNVKSTDKLYTILTEILNELNEEFQVNLKFSPKIMYDLMLHIKIALLRIRFGILINNPLKEKMRNEYPFIYDMGLRMSEKIHKKLNLKLTQDEISYLVSYLGVAFNQSNLNLSMKNSLNILLIVLEGNATSNHISHTICNLFDNKKIDITSISTNYEVKTYEKNFHKYDLIITTSNLLCQSIKSCLLIHPSFNLIDQFKVKNTLNDLLKNLKKHNFEIIFSHFFNEEFFHTNINLETRDDSINYMCNTLRLKNYIDDNYVKSVFERENLISTAINTGVALPHATNARSIKTTVFVTIFKKPINWDKTKIKSAFLFAINKKDAPQLSIIYDLVINIFSDKNKVEDLSKITLFKDFKKLLWETYFEN